MLLRESTMPSAEMGKVSDTDREQLTNQWRFSVFTAFKLKKHIGWAYVTSPYPQ